MSKHFKSLENCFCLSHHVTVFVPSRQKTGEPCEDRTDRTAELMSELFGGATASKAVGYWILSTTGKLQREGVTTVFSYAENLTEENVSRLVEYLRELKTACNQDAVGAEIDGEMYFV